MPRNKVDVAKRMVDAHNSRDVDGLFAELVNPDFEWYTRIVRALGGGESATGPATGFGIRGRIRSVPLTCGWSRSCPTG